MVSPTCCPTIRSRRSAGQPRSTLTPTVKRPPGHMNEVSRPNRGRGVPGARSARLPSRCRPRTVLDRHDGVLQLVEPARLNRRAAAMCSPSTWSARGTDRATGRTAGEPSEVEPGSSNAVTGQACSFRGHRAGEVCADALVAGSNPSSARSPRRAPGRSSGCSTSPCVVTCTSAPPRVLPMEEGARMARRAPPSASVTRDQRGQARDVTLVDTVLDRRADAATSRSGHGREPGARLDLVRRPSTSRPAWRPPPGWYRTMSARPARRRGAWRTLLRGSPGGWDDRLEVPLGATAGTTSFGPSASGPTQGSTISQRMGPTAVLVSIRRYSRRPGPSTADPGTPRRRR